MMRLRLQLLLFLFLLIPVAGLAQDGGQNSLLPEINPQDIEIRSEFRARFPGLRRQPILGFNPKPRVFQIDPDRMPFMENRDEAVADISITQLGRPEPPARNTLNDPNRINAFVKAGYGSFTTPILNGYAVKKIDDHSLVAANMNLMASGGHLSEQESSVRNFDFSARYLRKLKNDLKVQFELGGLMDYNDLFHLEDNLQQNQIGFTSNKDYQGFSGRLSLQRVRNTLHGWDLNVHTNLFSTTLNAGNSGLSGDLNEQLLSTSYSYYWPGNRLYETHRASALLTVGKYASSLEPEQDWLFFSGDYAYERLLNFNTRIKAQPGIAYISDPNSDKLFFTLDAELKYNFTDALSVNGNLYTFPEMQTVHDHHQVNRFLNIQTGLRHRLTLGASGEVNFQLFDGNRIFGGILYESIDNYAYYQRTGATPAFYDALYGNASLFELHAGISQQLIPEKFWASGRLDLRSPKLKDGGTIPYEEKIRGEINLSYKPIEPLKIDAWAEYLGKRSSPETTSELKPFLLVNAGAEYQINESFGIYAKLLNILGQDYEIWDGYTERPFQVFGGLTFKF